MKGAVLKIVPFHALLAFSEILCLYYKNLCHYEITVLHLNLLVLRQRMQLLSKQNVPYTPGCMLHKADAAQPAER